MNKVDCAPWLLRTTRREHPEKSYDDGMILFIFKMNADLVVGHGPSQL